MGLVNDTLGRLFFLWNFLFYYPSSEGVEEWGRWRRRGTGVLLEFYFGIGAEDRKKASLAITPKLRLEGSRVRTIRVEIEARHSLLQLHINLPEDPEAVALRLEKNCERDSHIWRYSLRTSRYGLLITYCIHIHTAK